MFLRVMFVASMKLAPRPEVFEMVPPEPSVVPVPFTVKLPFALLMTIPFGELLADTLTNVMFKGVVPLLFVISTAVPLVPLVVIEPPDVVMVLVFSVASNPR
jgi:hypothetical protein